MVHAMLNMYRQILYIYIQFAVKPEEKNQQVFLEIHYSNANNFLSCTTYSIARYFWMVMVI